MKNFVYLKNEIKVQKTFIYVYLCTVANKLTIDFGCAFKMRIQEQHSESSSTQNDNVNLINENPKINQVLN